MAAINRFIMNVILLVVILSFVVDETRTGAEAYINDPLLDQQCKSQHWSKKCLLEKLHKPLRIFDSLSFLIRNRPKDNEDKIERLHTSTTSTTPVATAGVITEMPKPTVKPDTQASIMKDNLHRLETEPCGMSYTNTNEIKIWPSPKEYPWLALLLYKSNNSTISELEILCGGSLINDRYIITSAHCGAMADYKLSSVRLGEYNLEYFEPNCADRDEGFVDEISIEACEGVLPEEYDVSEVIMHPDYESSESSLNHLHDIALIRLDKKVQFTIHINPVCLPVGDLKFAWNRKNYATNLTVVGWGISDVQRITFFSLVDPSICKEDLGVILKNGQLCMKHYLKDEACVGNSGGPLVISTIFGLLNNEYGMKAMKSVQVGVLSSKLCYEDLPMVFTSIDTYLPWILRTLKP